MASALLCLAAPRAVQAQDASGWAKDNHAEARLIAGALNKAADAAFVRAGIEIRLEPGWKTYWREPGDSGVPPSFDFAGSANVSAVRVLWPAPERFPDGAGGNSIGYTGRVILLLRVIPKDAAQQSALHVKLGYAICGTLCVPAEAKLDLVLSGDGAEEAAIEREESHVPRRVALGAGSGLAIRSVHREPGGEHDRVVVDVAAPGGATVNLFVEGPTPDWALPLPELRGMDGNLQHFAFDLDGLPPGARTEGANLTFTAVAGDDAIEVPVHLD